MRFFQIQVHQAQRTLRGCSYDPTPRFAGLDHKLSPCLRRGFGRQAFGNRFQVAFHGYGTAKNACSDTKESFLFGGLSPPNKKITSLRPRRLCGENSILDKNDTAYEKILGIVDHDLYVPELNFVFGEASRIAAVISLTRLRQGFYHLPENRSLFHQRILTEAVHELGHTYGLRHCENPRCVMFFSNSLMDTDRKGPAFCARCKSKLYNEK